MHTKYIPLHRSTLSISCCIPLFFICSSLYLSLFYLSFTLSLYFIPPSLCRSLLCLPRCIPLFSVSRIAVSLSFLSHMLYPYFPSLLSISLCSVMFSISCLVAVLPLSPSFSLSLSLSLPLPPSPPYVSPQITTFITPQASVPLCVRVRVYGRVCVCVCACVCVSVCVCLWCVSVVYFITVVKVDLHATRQAFFIVLEVIKHV